MVGLPIAVWVFVDIAEQKVRLLVGEVADMRVLVQWVDVMSEGPKVSWLEAQDDGL